VAEIIATLSSGLSLPLPHHRSGIVECAFVFSFSSLTQKLSDGSFVTLGFLFESFLSFLSSLLIFSTLLSCHPL